MLQDLVVDLNAFEIIDMIGEGRMREVYLIQEKKTGKYLAAKVLKKVFTSHTLQKNFNDQIMLYSKIQNPAILPLYGINFTDFNNESHPTIITKYMENGSISDLVTRNRQFPLSKKYLLLLGITLGMKYLHSRQIIHGDLQPDNILLDTNYRPLICDFLQSTNNDHSNIIYKSPEVLLGKKPTIKSDVYSFSILAYRLITNKSPYPLNNESIDSLKKKNCK